MVWTPPGKPAAIAEQTSEPVPGKLVSREIARILTPGSIDDDTLLDNQRPNDLVDSRSGKSHMLLGVLDRTATP